MLTVRKKITILFTCLIVCMLFFVNATPSHAQEPGIDGAATQGVATMVNTNVKNVKDGSVLSNSENQAILSTTPYDPQVLGVVSRDAAFSLIVLRVKMPFLSSQTAMSTSLCRLNRAISKKAII